MPKPASGQPHWEAIAVKLPPALMAEVRRYTDIHGLALSDLVRQGLEMRLHGEAPPSWYNGHTERLSHLLHGALALVQEASAHALANQHPMPTLTPVAPESPPPEGTKVCGKGHDPYPASKAECPHCVRERQQARRQRQADRLRAQQGTP